MFKVMKDNESGHVASLSSPQKPTPLPETCHEKCLFLHAELNHRDATSIPKRPSTEEDIRVIMPASWKFTITCNVITIEDTNDQSIRIVFQNPIEAGFNLEETNSPTNTADLEPNNSGKIYNRTSGSENNSPNSSALENVFHNRMENKFSTEKCLKTPVINDDDNEGKLAKPNKQKEQFNFRRLKQRPNSFEPSFNLEYTNSSTNIASLEPNNFGRDGSSTPSSEIRSQNYKTWENSSNINLLNNKSAAEICIKSVNISGSYKNNAKPKTTEREQSKFLSLEQPLLLKYKDGNKQSHVLMYMFHSVQSMSSKCASSKYSEVVQNLLKSSVPYVGDSVYWLFNPQRQILKLKQMEKNSSIPKHFSDAKDDMMKKLANEYMSLSKMAECYKEKNIFIKPVRSFGTKLPDRKRMSRTALKRVNVRQIATSIFNKNFNFYSHVAGHLQSGAVITRSNSNYWLMVSGVATDARTQRLASELFTATAGAKVVLNIYDYLRFLITFARRRKIIMAELVKQMAACRQTQIIDDRSQQSHFIVLK